MWYLEWYSDTRDGVLEILKLEIECLKINVIRIREIKWSNLGNFWIGNYKLIHTSSVGGYTEIEIMINKECHKNVRNYFQYSDRTILVKIYTQSISTTII